MSENDQTWRQRDLAKGFLEEIRGAIPLAGEQIDVLLRVVRVALPKVDRLLDLGCGDGILGRTLLDEHRRASAVFLDLSEYMIEAARQKTDCPRASFVVRDLSAKSWIESVAGQGPFDLVVSSLAIHHLTDERKQELYGEIFDLLSPGGLFLNLEHVSARSEWSKRAYNDFFVDMLWAQHRRQGGGKTRDEIAEQWRLRLGKAQDLTAAVEDQCEWLRRIGFADVDCFFKIFELALFGGKKK